ncbi:MAG: galactose oxidase-like domain-containing protein [Actinomycetota bacterium]
MTRRRLLSGVVAVALIATLGSPGAGATDRRDAAAAKTGSWSKPFAELPVFAKRPPRTPKESMKIPPAVSMAVLPDGRIIYWGGLESLENSDFPIAADAPRTVTKSRSRILDIRDGTPSWSVPKPENAGAHDLFCADQRLLADGRLIAVGGTVWRSDPVDLKPVTGDGGPAGTGELFGSNSVRTFDPRTNRWDVNKKWMKFSRWYPSLITMGNGKLLVASGVERLLYNDKGLNVHATETFNPKTGKWKNNGADGETSLPLFARLHLLPDGNVFYSGVGQMWGPFGQAVDEALWHFYKGYDPKRNEWTTYGAGHYGARSGAFSVMLPLEPPYLRADILIAGGTLATSPGSYVANNLTEIVRAVGGQAVSMHGPDLNNPRWFSSGVALPDGSVLAVSGASRDEVILPGSESPVTQAELYNGKRWVPLENATRVRTYHNSAVLLADGSVLVGGHSPINTGYGAKGDNSAEAVTGTNNLKDPSFEILEPPYLFRGPRPTITHAQKGIAWRSTFDVGTAGGGDIKKVVLSRLPAVTHITDPDQRTVELDFKAAGNGRLSVAAPPNGNVAPAGYYYLFVLSDNGDGLTPSKARIVRVGPRAQGGEAVAPMGR